MKTFQTILLTICGLITVVSVIVFAKFPAETKKDQSTGGASGNVSIWGTFEVEGGRNEVFSNFNKKFEKVFSVSYEYHDPTNFDGDIVEALASGRGPDILLLPDNLILRHSDKIELIPYGSVPQRTFQDTFVQASEIYMRDQGLIALPFAIDPMVMYWNRDLFNNASVTLPPAYWDEFLTLAPKLTRHDQKTSEIKESAISFGEYSNVQNAKDIIAMLFLQVGNTIVKMNKGKPAVDLLNTEGTRVSASQDVVSAFRFFMDFSNPLQNIYSWSRALPNSRDQFINGNLAVYFDYASAYKDIQLKNPHLNFAVAPVPQLRGAKVNITYARMHGLAVLKSSKNKLTALVAVQRLLESEPSGQFAAAFSLPPVRRDLLNKRPTDTTLSVFYDSAIRARTWLDPRPEESDKAFRTAVESVSSGRNDISQSVTYLSNQLQSALRPYQ